MANNNVGPKRLVVGAHYGLRDWMAQRATAVVMAIYTVILLVSLFSANNFTYSGWAELFAPQWFKAATFVAFVALFYHAWVGMRDILMDYCTKSVALRLVLQIAAIAWLIGCAFYAAQILWRA